MKLLTAQVVNFGSYKNLTINFDNQGLALIYGATGSGKSTLQDIPVWILFGSTAKNGSVDEIRSWFSPEDATLGVLSLKLNNSTITITRIRGSTSENDLFWQEEGSEDLYRGKDISDTQKLLNARLNVNEYIYTVGAYYNEFSPTGSFFTAKSSDRRQLFENIADLEFPTILIEKIGLNLKTIKTLFDKANTDVAKTQGILESLNKQIESLKKRIADWEKDKQNKLSKLIELNEAFESDKQKKLEEINYQLVEFEAEEAIIKDTLTKQIVSLNEHLLNNKAVCDHCGQPDKIWNKNNINKIKVEAELSTLEKKVNPWIAKKTEEYSKENTYTIQIQQLIDLSNPFQSQLNGANNDINEMTNKLKEQINQQVILKHKQSSLDQLRKITENLKKELCKNTERQINTETNRLLETYFDSEIRVMFQLENKDKLNIDIWKSGHQCSYTQLSKGQRSLLKLCFSIACMKAISNKSGVHFDTIMMDEALDGLDTNLKLKAFSLFSELSLCHDSVFIIDHNEGLQNLFDKQYYVIIDSDISTIKKV